MANTKNAISWFEIPVDDYDRAKKFYEGILDAEFGEMDIDGTKLAMFPADEGQDAVGGALIASPDVKPSEQGSVVYIDANPDLQIVLNRIESAGKSVFIPKTQVGPDMGFFAQFKDSEGNRVGLYSMA